MSHTDDFALAAEQGRICALAMRGQRDLQRLAERHPELFAARPFDAALFGSVALAIAFSAPRCSAEELRTTNRWVLWGFAVDWHIDYLATSRSDADGVVTGCLAVAAGGAPEPTDPLGRFLADLRDELAVVPGFAGLRDIWLGEVRRALTAMAREWDWRTDTPAGRLPTFEEYLDNAANLACTAVNVAHWIRVGDAETHRRLPDLVAASDEVQRVLRLVNDLATYARDLTWGDLNAVTLLGDAAKVRERADALLARCRTVLAALAVDLPREAAFLSRQVAYTSGFYGTTDFWGER